MYCLTVLCRGVKFNIFQWKITWLFISPPDQSTSEVPSHGKNHLGSSAGEWKCNKPVTCQGLSSWVPWTIVGRLQTLHTWFRSLSSSLKHWKNQSTVNRIQHSVFRLCARPQPGPERSQKLTSLSLLTSLQSRTMGRGAAFQGQILTLSVPATQLITILSVARDSLRFFLRIVILPVQSCHCLTTNRTVTDWVPESRHRYGLWDGLWLRL